MNNHVINQQPTMSSDNIHSPSSSTIAATPQTPINNTEKRTNNNEDNETIQFTAETATPEMKQQHETRVNNTTQTMQPSAAPFLPVWIELDIKHRRERNETLQKIIEYYQQQQINNYNTTVEEKDNKSTESYSNNDVKRLQAEIQQWKHKYQIAEQENQR